MNILKKKAGSGGDIRSFLKQHHRKVYSFCRLFATTYKEQQELFSNMLAAISQSLMGLKMKTDKNQLLLRACINMAALHSITLSMQGGTPKGIQFKSPDFQTSMVKLNEALGEISDFEKIRLFLQLENPGAGKLSDLTGSNLDKSNAQLSSKNFIPYIKQKLVWN